MIGDREWLATYISTNRRRLRANYDAVSGALRANDIAFSASHAGFFLVADLRRFLPATATFADEAALWRRLLNEANVNLTPGADMRCAEPGFFRVCFASIDAAHCVVAIDKIIKVLRQP